MSLEYILFAALGLSSAIALIVFGVIGILQARRRQRLLNELEANLALLRQHMNELADLIERRRAAGVGPKYVISFPGKLTAEAFHSITKRVNEAVDDPAIRAIVLSEGGTIRELNRGG